MRPHEDIQGKPTAYGYSQSMQSSMVSNLLHDTESQALRRKVQDTELQ